MDRDNFQFLHDLRVRWNECDMHGIVFNVNYFLYYDVAAYEWQRAIWNRTDAQPEFVTAHAECDFLKPALFDEELAIGVRCAAIGSKSINLETAVFRGSELLNRGKLTYVHVDKGISQSAELSQHAKDSIIAFERFEPLRSWKKAGSV